MERRKSMGLLKSFFSYTSQLSGASILSFWFLTSPPPSASSSAITVGRVRGWQRLLDLRHCVPFWEPSFAFGSPHSHLEARNRWRLLHSYLLTRQEIFHFTVHTSPAHVTPQWHICPCPQTQGKNGRNYSFTFVSFQRCSTISGI